MSKKNITAFFGGSFDPPHPGHLGVALGALNSGRCSCVLWVPAYAPPHKQGLERAPFETRIRMVSDMIAEQTAMQVSDIEKRLALDPSYTIKVLEHAKAEIDGEIALLIGADSLAQLHTWHRAHELVEAYQILTYPRNTVCVDEEYLKQYWNPSECRKLLSGVLDGKFFEISSTEIRKKMAKNAKWSDIKELTKEIMDSSGQTLSGISEKQENNMDGKIDYKALLDFCIKCAEDKLAENISTLEIGKVSSVADYMMIATASSEPQLRALASFIERQVREEYKLRTLNQPDDSSSGWVLLDFGNLIVHLMTPESRERYDLEGLWGESPTAETASRIARR